MDIKPLVYVASPYSHHDKEIEQYRHTFVSAFTATLNSNGVIAISPIVYGLKLIEYKEMPSDWDFWKTFCLSLLDKCDILFVLKLEGYDTSPGVQAEIQYAMDKGKEIRYIDA